LMGHLKAGWWTQPGAAGICGSVAKHGSIGVEKKELTCGAHMLVAGERRGGADGRCNTNGETHSREGTNGTGAWWASWAKWRFAWRVGPPGPDTGEKSNGYLISNFK
jgi:hypothetical protein